MLSEEYNSMENKEGAVYKANFVQYIEENIFDLYHFDEKELGEGAFGTVYKGKLKDGTENWRAIKKIEKKAIKEETFIQNEIQNLVKLDHPTIIKIYEIFEDDEHLYLVIDICEGGELFEKLEKMGSFSEKDAREIFEQMMKAISYCHNEKIAHRDLKPENFMFLNNDSFNLKLIDFGLSFKWEKDMRKELAQKKDNKILGTAYYISPEMVEGSYDEKCDIWALGVILYILVAAIPPFDGKTEKEIISKIKKGFYTFAIPEMVNVSSECKDLIKRMLMPEIRRPTLQQIFNHPWMKSSNLSDVPLNLNFGKMSEFAKSSKLRRLTANFIAARLSESEVEKLCDVFQKIDLNHDGLISLEELKIALDSQADVKSLNELRELIEGIDTDKNGMINYTEFLASTEQVAHKFNRDNLEAFFKTIDKDDNGIVDKEELAEALAKESMNGSSGQEVDDIIAQCDQNNDGNIDMEEFIAAMLP